MAPRTPRIPRLTDVAGRARVSIATVSRVLSGHGPASPEVRARVLKAARALDYRPNRLASGLRSRRSDTIGLVLPDIENPFFTALFRGVEQAAAARGWNVILGNSDEDLTREEAVVRTLAERQIDGLILSPVGGSHAYLKRYLALGLPIVSVNRAMPDVLVPTVVSDNEQGASEAVRHLLEKGYRPLGLILGTPGLSTTESKLAACRRVALEFGLAEDALIMRVGFGRTVEGYKAARECLECAPRPRAIFAFNNLMAESALMAIHDRGLVCPADVALIGFDDFRSAAALSPALTVVEQDPVGMGARAVEELSAAVETGTMRASCTLLPTRLLIRGSCGCRPRPISGAANPAAS
jgi:LacI family transcriptional regulator